MVTSDGNDVFTVLRGFWIGDATGAVSGGGLYLTNSSSPRVANCVFHDNGVTTGGQTNVEGGAVANIGTGDPMFVNCEFRNNAAPETSGAFYNDDGNPSFHNCLFAENSSKRGGVMRNVKGNPMFINCTFADNQAFSGNGGAILSQSGGTVVIRNSILWGNTATGSGPQISGSATVTYSDVEGGWSGTGNINVDPDFSAPELDSYAISTTSPCKNAANTSLLPPDIADLDWDCNRTESVPDDLAGFTRVVGSAVDMGSYEVVIVE